MSFTLCAVTPMESFCAPKCCFGVLCSTCQYVNICFFVSFFFLLWPCLWTGNVLGSSSLLWALCMCACVFKYTAVGFMEALKPSFGLFHNGSILSFALVQGVDPESFVCNWIPMQVLSCNHLVPHHCWVESQPGRDNWCSDRWMCLHSLEIESKGDNGDMTNPYWTITTFSYSWSWIKLSYTGLLGYLPVCSCNCIAMIIGGRQGYYCMEFPVGMIMWKDICSKHSLTLLQPPRGKPYIYRKCYKYMR